MPLWQHHLFIAMSRSASDANEYFQIPIGTGVEVGTQMTIWRIMHFCMPWPQNQARLCCKRRTISRPRFATMQ